MQVGGAEAHSPLYDVAFWVVFGFQQPPRFTAAAATSCGCAARATQSTAAENEHARPRPRDDRHARHGAAPFRKSAAAPSKHGREGRPAALHQRARRAARDGPLVRREPHHVHRRRRGDRRGQVVLSFPNNGREEHQPCERRRTPSTLSARTNRTDCTDGAACLSQHTLARVLAEPAAPTVLPSQHTP
jgi:hypothetical protein